MHADQISVALVCDATPENIWHEFTAGRPAWWPEMAFEAIPGAALIETWVEDGKTLQATGAVTTVHAPHLLAFEWSEPEWHGHLTVTICITSVTGGTEVVVTERGFTSITAPATLASEHEEGWAYHLNRLRESIG